ncbi:MAG: hypothetical protein WAW52_12675 [Methanothrix sp.]
MITKLQRILMSVVVCILVFASTTVVSQDVSEISPIVALKDLYDNNQEFHTTMDQAFAHMNDPDPSTVDLWPNPTAVNP